MMNAYAIVAEDGRQLKLEAGQEVLLDFRDIAAGEKLALSRVLAVRNEAGIKIGKPVVDGATVEVEIIGVAQGPKLVVQKFRRRKNSRRRTGHRQIFTKARVLSISGV